MILNARENVHPESIVALANYFMSELSAPLLFGPDFDIALTHVKCFQNFW